MWGKNKSGRTRKSHEWQPTLGMGLRWLCGKRGMRLYGSRVPFEYLTCAYSTFSKKNFNSEILHVDSDFWYFWKMLKALTTVGQSLL